MWRNRAWIVLALATTAVARADGERSLDVPLGKTIEVKVSSARGWFCDDPSLVEADVVTHDGSNWWQVKGVAAGTTTCRVGTNPALLHYVFVVRVTEAKR